MISTALWVIVGLLLLGILLPVVGGMMAGGWVPGVMGPGMMGGWWGGGGVGWGWALAMLLGGLGMLAFWAAVIAGIVLLVRWVLSAGGPAREPPQASPLEILKRRYAQGEIDQATYERMRRELEQ